MVVMSFRYIKVHIITVGELYVYIYIYICVYIYIGCISKAIQRMCLNRLWCKCLFCKKKVAYQFIAPVCLHKWTSVTPPLILLMTMGFYDSYYRWW